MIDVSNVLSNTMITILNETIVKDTKGGANKSYIETVTGLKAKIESQEMESPVTISGKSYRHWYLIHIWAQDEVLPDINDNDFIKDESNNKGYKILEIQPANLHKNKPYKYEVKAIVLADDRFNKSEDHI